MVNKKEYKTYKRGQILYVDLGHKPEGVQGGLRPCVVVSNDASNHKYAPQITVCALTTKLKKTPVHVIVKPDDIKGYSLLKDSDFLPEDITTVSKKKVCGTMGYIPRNGELMNKINIALATQLGLIGVVGSATETLSEGDNNAR